MLPIIMVEENEGGGVKGMAGRALVQALGGGRRKKGVQSTANAVIVKPRGGIGGWGMESGVRWD